MSNKDYKRKWYKRYWKEMCWRITLKIIRMSLMVVKYFLNRSAGFLIDRFFEQVFKIDFFYSTGFIFSTAGNIKNLVSVKNFSNKTFFSKNFLNRTFSVSHHELIRRFDVFYLLFLLGRIFVVRHLWIICLISTDDVISNAISAWCLSIKLT